MVQSKRITMYEFLPGRFVANCRQWFSVVTARVAERVEALAWLLHTSKEVYISIRL